MPTRDRRRFAERAITYFLRQDFPDRELVILDDGHDEIRDLIPAGPIRYEHLDRPLVLGAKRNAGNELATGEIIVHWDDDDWQAPDRVSRQVAALSRANADLCGTGDQLYYEPATDRAWRYRYPVRRRWVAGNTLCYLRDRWREHPFPPVATGEDNHFVFAGRPPAEVPGVFHIGIVHPGNTAAKDTTGSFWTPAAPATAHRHLGPDLDFYRSPW
ncbi:hypothetical protein GCM10010112_12730 [Actinoplanes lobatus]|nr:glycosyltransferase family A protein [Actinoplanes lobatus]GGN58711.1 hypothetical protein GCM10010112_12730 [Actinoplanes lobatus]GIE43029.1 hypothetical protein Alo02nite_59270 [Actinoplanes lobatus]